MNTFCDEYIMANHQYLKTKLDSMPTFHFGMHGGKRTIRISVKDKYGKRMRYESIHGGRRYKEYSDQMAEREKLSKQMDYFDHELRKRRLIVPENMIVYPQNTRFTSKLWEELATGLNELGKGKGYYDNHMNNVDSRGEMLIADALDDLHLEYKYEVLYLLNPHRKIFPDFVVLIPALGRFFFIEFMGMADDPNYMDNNSSRIENYIRNGIYPGRDLLIIVGNRDYLPTVNAVKRRIISFINDLTLDSVLIP